MRVLPFSGLLIVLITCGTLRAARQTKPSAAAPSSVYQTGVAAFERGDLPAARTAFQQAVKLTPQSVEAQNMLGQVLLRQGELDGAIATFRTVVALRPSLPIAHAYLAQALQAKGRLDDAVAEFRTAVRLAPKQWQAHQSLGRALNSQNKMKKRSPNSSRRFYSRPDSLNCMTNWDRCWPNSLNLPS